MHVGRMRTEKCGVCEKNTLKVIPTLVTTGNPKVRRFVDVGRCLTCDTSECNACGHRDLAVNGPGCRKCGAPMLPKVKGEKDG